MARSKDKQKEERDKYQTWKQNIPIIYDWILNHHLTWPSQSCRWAAITYELTLLSGPQQKYNLDSSVALTWLCMSRWGLQVEDFKYKRRQKVYLSDRVGAASFMDARVGNQRALFEFLLYRA